MNETLVIVLGILLLSVVSGMLGLGVAFADTDALMSTGWARLTPSERIALADNLVAAFASGALQPFLRVTHLRHLRSP